MPLFHLSRAPHSGKRAVPALNLALGRRRGERHMPKRKGKEASSPVSIIRIALSFVAIVAKDLQIVYVELKIWE